MTHDHACACLGCSEMGAILERDPREILRSARQWLPLWDHFAFGVLLNAELECQGYSPVPPKYLPQSNPGVDYDVIPSWRLTRSRYKYA